MASSSDSWQRLKPSQDSLAPRLTSSSFNLSVQSATFLVGNFANFYVNGVQLNVPSSRGLNVVLLQTSGALLSFNAFDTFATGSDALVSFLNSISPGTIVMVAAMDEASGNLSSAARTAIATLGATQIDDLQWRSSYALIGIKGFPSIAEKASSAAVAVSAMYSPNLVATGQAFDLSVASASYALGNYATFYVNGSQLNLPVGRGLNVAVLQSAGSLSSFQAFDTMTNGSDALVAFINTLSPGTVVMIAVMDEAAGNLSASARLAIQSLGATQIAQLAWRGSYALIGVKGGSCIAEQLGSAAGPAVRVDAVYAPVVPPPPPILDLVVRSGSFSAGNIAEFYVNGMNLGIPCGRGLNFVLLRRNGTLLTYTTFDTFAAGSDGLVTFVNGLRIGSIVMIAAMDEASTNLTSAAKAAIMTLGATEINTMAFRSSYALIGMKGGPKIAEQLARDGFPAVRIHTSYTLGSIPPSTFSMTIRSAAFSAGNFADFYVDNVLLPVSTARGMNLAVLQSNGSLLAASTFDTDAAGSDSLVTFVRNLNQGAIVLVAAQDEARGNLSADALTALESLGAIQVQNLSFRGSYALIGVKGDFSLAEGVSPDGSPLVAISAIYPLPATSFPSTTIRVRSAGFGMGNLAEFYVNGAKLNIPTFRGLNFVTLQPTGVVIGFVTFDTMGTGSDALVSFVNNLQAGTLVLVAAMDEAKGNLSAAAMSAIQTLGALQIQNLQFRGAYALIGVKGGMALAEQVGADGGPVDEVSIQFTMASIVFTTSTTTTSTTTTVPLCVQFKCPAGMILGPNMWNLTGSKADVCCSNASSSMIGDVSVQSAGFSDGDMAIFYSHGRMLLSAISRGMTVVTMRSDGSRKDYITFDTYADGSDALVAYISGMANGTVVLVGAQDEASNNFTQAARNALKTCGATLVDQVGYRSGYALIGVKGGQALAESVKPMGAGWAVAVAQTEVTASQVAVDLPICDPGAQPPVKGYVSDGNLQLEAGCRYRLYEDSAVSACSQGMWYVIAGSSNTWLQFVNLLHILVPDNYLINQPFEDLGEAALIDAIVENNKISYWAYIDNNLAIVKQVDMSIATQNRPVVKKMFSDLLAKAPSYDGSKIRLTFVLSFFWDRSGLALEVVNEATAWAASDVYFMTQVGAWYNVCALTKEAYCPRQELLKMDSASAITVFKSEMEAALVALQAFCSPTGRASKRGCAVETISWSNAGGDQANFKVMNSYMTDAMRSKQSATMRYFDFFNLGGAMPEEVINGHGSQILTKWALQIQFNSICPASLASDKPYTVWDGPLCSGTEVTFDLCPDYYPACLNGQRCEQWECMQTVACIMRAEEPPSVDARALVGMCADPVSAGAYLASLKKVKAPEQRLDPCYNTQGLRIRVWCRDDGEWILPVACVLLAAATLIALRLWVRFRPPVDKDKAKAKAKGEAAKAAETDIHGVQPPKDELMPNLLLGREPSSKDCVASRPGTEPQSPACSDSGSDTCKKACSSRAKSSIDIDADEDYGPALHERQPLEENSDTSARVVVVVEIKSEAGPDKSEGRENEKANDSSLKTTDVSATVAVSSPAPAETKKAPPKFQAAGNKFPLGLARFLASSHVVVGHLYAKGVTPNIIMFGWGFTWVPWFFMLSGFVLFSANLQNPKPETMIEYVMRRSTTIYPLYAFSLLPAFAIAKGLGNLTAGPGTIVAQCFLLQAWWPGITESAMQMHCWFLSCMVLYWFFFKPLAWFFRGLTLLRTLALMAFCFFLPWLAIIGPLIAGKNLDWYKEHSSIQTDTALDFGVVVLKFNPICYVHVFITGMLLAKLRLLLDAKALAAGAPDSWRNPYRVAIQFVAPLGYLMLLLVFNVQGFQPQIWGYKVTARLSVLLPFQGMVLFGLAGLPSLPLPFFAQFFAKFNILENYSYAVYVFQFIFFALWPQSGTVNVPLFLIFTYASAVIIASTIQQFVQKWWTEHTRARLVVPFVLAAVLGGLSVLPDPSVPNTTLSDVPAFVRLDERMVDVRLAVYDAEGQSMGATTINPSVVFDGNNVIIVARRHRRETQRYIGNHPIHGEVTFMDQIWHSDIVIGRTTFDPQSLLNWPTSGQEPFGTVPLQRLAGLRTPAGGDWSGLCPKQETWLANNRTILRYVVSGPEDPKIIIYNGSVTVPFDSQPPANGNLSSCRHDAKGYLAGVTQMYVAGGVNPDSPLQPVITSRLAYGQTDKPEKNWVAFTKDNDLMFAYTPMPHIILKSALDGTTDKISSSKFQPLQTLTNDNVDLEVRGSGQALFVNDPEATPNLPRPHYLALLHLFDASSGRYATYAYRFGPTPPFLMLQISSPLPLTEAEAEIGGIPFAFASGLALFNRTVVITYGAGDRDSRSLVLRLERLDEMFNCSKLA